MKLIFVDDYESNATSNENNSCTVNGDNNKEKTTKTMLRDNASNRKTYDGKYVTKLKKNLKTTVAACCILKKKLRQVNSMFNTVFNKDKRYFIAHGNHRGVSWSTNTITKALRLYVACGKRIRGSTPTTLPYPSIRCLQHRIQRLKFKPGIFEDIFNLLKIKVSIILMPEFSKVNLRHLEALLTHSLLFTEMK